MPPHSLTNSEIHKHYQNEIAFNGVYFRNNLPKIKGRIYVTNLDEYESIGNYWIALYVKASNNTKYFDSCGVKHIPKEIKEFIDNRNITQQISLEYKIKIQ